MKRKHRIVVEMTFDQPITGKSAKKLVTRVIDGCDIEQAISEERIRTGAEWTHYSVKDGARVIAAERLKGRVA